MNVELLKKVAAKLRRMRHKKHFFMFTFFRKNECGTAACIAGHGLLITGYKPVFKGDRFDKLIDPRGKKLKDTSELVASFIAARKEFGLTTKQAEALFLEFKWPEGFDPNDPKSAAARIEHFIKTKGKE